jgi:hypothetical protein
MTRELQFTDGFGATAMPPIPLDEAIRRVVAFCSSRRSGFVAYDLAGHVARSTGRLREIGPWTILLADALAGQISVENADTFASHVGEFAELLRAVPQNKDLASLTHSEVGRVVEFCSYGFPGVWAPKVTKVGALYRPRAIPVLDGYVALAFGYTRDRFSVGVTARRGAIERVVEALREWIGGHEPELIHLRKRVGATVPDIGLLSDARLGDIVIWTSQDDRVGRPGKPVDAWLTASPAEPLSVGDIQWLSL